MEQAMRKVREFILKQMAEELVKQGHEVTGDLISSLFDESRVVERGGGIVLEGRFLHYGIQMDIGRQPGKFVPILALIEWVRRKGIASGDREIKRAAWAINWAIRREGIPTRGSRRMGKKTGWMTDTLNDNEGRIGQMLADGGEVEINNQILRMIKAA